MADDMNLIDVALETTKADRLAMIELLRETVAASLLESGCLIYRATVALDDPLAFDIVELWASESAYLDHSAGAALARFKKKLPTCGRVVSIKRRKGPLQTYEKRYDP